MLRRSGRVPVLVVGLILAVTPNPVSAQLRIAYWNVTNYSGGRVAEFQTAIYDVFQTRSMAPDVLIGGEFTSASSVTSFLSILNTAPGSPGDWAAADFVNGNDTDSALFYRTSVVELATDLSPNGVTVVAAGSGPPNHPRNIMRYDVRLAGATAPESTVAIYASHMKAGSAGTDQDRRLLEAQRIRDDAELLPAGWNFLLGADLNIQASTQAAYQELVGSQANNDGRFFDPINTPGNWNNNSGFRFVHTQDPAGAGGMDDRHDQILVSASLIDSAGFDYIGNPAVAYSTSTWNDGNHTYRSWGNDGTSFNNNLTISGNQMVGATIAQALVDSALNGGHLPVFLDFSIPDATTGACCTACGCVDGLDQPGCLAVGGDFRGVGVICGQEDPPCPPPPAAGTVLINEVLVAHDGLQDQEFVEIIGPPGELLCGLSILVIEGEGASRGQVDREVTLNDCGGSPCALSSNGYFVAGGSGLSPPPGQLVGSGFFVFEDGTETFLLVRDAAVGFGDDIDIDNDGIAEVPLGTVVDAIGMIDAGYPASDVIYLGAPPFGPDGTTVPAGAGRCPDGADTDTLADWVALSRAIDGSDGCLPATPGSANPSGCGGDVDGDGDYDLADFAALQECFGTASAACSALELDGACGIDEGDYDLFEPLLSGSGP